jgi:hypothetical protein
MGTEHLFQLQLSSDARQWFKSIELSCGARAMQPYEANGGRVNLQSHVVDDERLVRILFYEVDVRDW